MVPPALAQADAPNRVEVPARGTSGPVHLVMTICCAILLVFCLIAAPPGAAHNALPLLTTILVLIPGLLVPAAFFHERKSWDRRDAVLMLPWTLLIAMLMTQAAPTAATHTFPLRDELWRRLDELLGIGIPAIMDFTARHPLVQSVLTYSYYWTLHPLILCAIFLPPILGIRRVAQRFVLANAIGFVLGLPCILLLPAVGPWVGWHFPPNGAQKACEVTIETLRRGSLLHEGLFGGIVCLPSYHVFWAVVSAHALQPFRVLRYPAILVASLITVSTMTTGWHYGIDVIAGILLAAFATFLAHAVLLIGERSTLTPQTDAESSPRIPIA